jgi:hypothetical protein
MFPTEEIKAKIEALPEDQKELHNEAVLQASVVVSDLYLYNQEYIDEIVEKGKKGMLVGLLKSKGVIPTYQGRVPKGVDKESMMHYFKTAVNEIIGKGKQIF